MRTYHEAWFHSRCTRLYAFWMVSHPPPNSCVCTYNWWSLSQPKTYKDIRIYYSLKFHLILQVCVYLLSMFREGGEGGGGGGGRRVLQIFQNKFVAQQNIDLNISWPSNFFVKYFMAPPINFSFLFTAYLLVAEFQGSTHSDIQISNH